MKKLVCLLLFVVFLCGLVACGTEEDVLAPVSETSENSEISEPSENSEKPNPESPEDAEKLPYEIFYEISGSTATVVDICVNKDYVGDVHIVIPETDPDGNIVTEVNSIPTSENPVFPYCKAETFDEICNAIEQNVGRREEAMFAAYYVLKDLNDPYLTDSVKENMEKNFPLCKYGAIYVLDPSVTSYEIKRLSDYIGGSGLDDEFFKNAAQALVDMVPDEESELKANTALRMNGYINGYAFDKVIGITFPSTVAVIDTVGFEGYVNLQGIDGLSPYCVLEIGGRKESDEFEDSISGEYIFNEETAKLCKDYDCGKFMEAVLKSYPNGDLGEIIQTEDVALDDSAEETYNKAVELVENGDYESAYKLLAPLAGYAPADEMLGNFKVCYQKTETGVLATEYSYDSYGNVSKITTGDSIYYEYTYTYDEKGKVLKSVETQYEYNIGSDDVSKTNVIHEYTYDSEGNILKEVYYTENEPENIRTVEYRYNSLGKISESVSKNQAGGELICSYVYDNRGRIAKKISYGVHKSGQIFLEDINQYIYENGMLVTEVHDSIVWNYIYGEDTEVENNSTRKYSEFIYFYLPKN